MSVVKCSLVALVLLALAHNSSAQGLFSNNGNGGLFGSGSQGEVDYSTGGEEISGGYPGENNGYLPPPSKEGQPSDTRPNAIPPPREPTDNNGREDQGPPQFPIVQPQVGCAAALICVEEQFCTMTGVISKTAITLTEAQKSRRVPMVDCRNPDSGIVGKCCRDPDYVDPWPAGGNLPPNYKGGFDERGFPLYLNLTGKDLNELAHPNRPVQPAGSNQSGRPILPTGQTPGRRPVQPSFPRQPVQPSFPKQPAQPSFPVGPQPGGPSFGFQPQPQPTFEDSKIVPGKPEFEGSIIQPGFVQPEQPEDNYVIPSPSGSRIPQQPFGQQPKQPAFPNGPAVEIIPNQPNQPGQSFIPKQPTQVFVPQPKQPEIFAPQEPEQPTDVYEQPDGTFGTKIPSFPQKPHGFEPAQPEQPKDYQPGYPQAGQPEAIQPEYQPEQPGYQPGEQPEGYPSNGIKVIVPEQPEDVQQPQQPEQSYQPEVPSGQPAPGQKTFGNVQFPTIPNFNIPQGVQDFANNFLNPARPADTTSVQAPADVPDVPLATTTRKPFFSGFPVFGTKTEQETAYIAPHTPGAQCGIINQVSRPSGLLDDETAFGEIPWQAMILHNVEKKLLCSGVFVAPNAVLTAAHCVYGVNPSEVSVKAGEWKLSYELKHEEPLPFEIVPVEAIVSHPNYQLGAPGHDTAILYLKQSVKLDQHVDTICLPQQPISTVGQRKCISVGWGKTNLHLHLAGAKMNKIDVEVMNNNVCSQRVQNAESLVELDESLVCVKAAQQKNNMCQVDMGGPLACDRGDGIYEVVGVYSQDTGCSPTNQVATFAMVDSAWVKETLNAPVPQQSEGKKIHYHPGQPEVPCDCQQGSIPAGTNQYLPPY